MGSERITVIVDETRHPAVWPSPETSWIEVPALACPHCRTKPVRVSGVKGTGESGDYLVTQKGRCRDCDGYVGMIEVELGTLFGASEDARVMSGRYGKVI